MHTYLNLANATPANQGFRDIMLGYQTSFVIIQPRPCSTSSCGESLSRVTSLCCGSSAAVFAASSVGHADNFALNMATINYNRHGGGGADIVAEDNTSRNERHVRCTLHCNYEYLVDNGSGFGWVVTEKRLWQLQNMVVVVMVAVALQQVVQVIIIVHARCILVTPSVAQGVVVDRE